MIDYREATNSDTSAIAALHTASWRSAYRGLISQDFLNHRVETDRLERWRSRMLPAPPPGTYVCLALRETELMGFVCVELDQHLEWGALIDNLHVRPDSKGQGIGRNLMAHAAAWVHEQRPGANLHLFAIEANRPACAFYERLGGSAVQRLLRAGPDGEPLPEICYAWKSPFEGLVRARHWGPV